MSLAGILAIAAAALVALLSLRDRRAPIFALVAYAPFNVAVLGEFDKIPYANPVNALLLLAIAAGTVAPARGGEAAPSMLATPIGRAVAALAVTATIGLAVGLAIAPDEAPAHFVEWKRLVTPYVLFALVARFVAEPRDLERLLWILGGAALTIGVLSIRDYLRIGGYDEDKRAATIVGQANELAAYLAQAALLFGIVALEARTLGARLRVFLAGAAAAAGVGMLFCFSRGAYLGTLAGLGIYAVSTRRALVAPLGLAVVLGPLWLPAGVIARVNTGVTEQGFTDHSILTRFEVWQATLRMAADYPVGVGVGRFGETVKDYLAVPKEIDAHNQYLKNLGEQGPQGLAALLFLLGAAAATARRLARAHPDPRARAFAKAFLPVLVGTAALATGGSRLESLEPTALFFTSLALLARFDAEARGAAAIPDVGRVHQ
jgi:O-antigen ligase